MKTIERALEGTWTKRGDEWCVEIISAAARHFESKANHLKGRECWVATKAGKKSKVILGDWIDYGAAYGGGTSFVVHVDPEATQKARDAYFAAKQAGA